MSEPRNASPAVASAEEVVLSILKDNAALKALFDPAKQIYPDIAPSVPPLLYCVYKRLATRGKRRLGALTAGGPEWVTLEYLCCCADGDAKRGQSRVLADAVQSALEAVTYPATVLDRIIPSIKVREARQDLMSQSPEGEMLPDRVVRLEISVKLN
jgi:hypothetical protein